MDLDFTMDDDGYPTEETLQKIREYKLIVDGENSTERARSLITAIEQIWSYKSFIKWKENAGVDELYISTAGWSGNESIMSALEANEWFFCFHWVQSRRGGHYIFEFKKP